jgi:hypothetical protein
MERLFDSGDTELITTLRNAANHKVDLLRTVDLDKAEPSGFAIREWTIAAGVYETRLSDIEAAALCRVISATLTVPAVAEIKEHVASPAELGVEAEQYPGDRRNHAQREALNRAMVEVPVGPAVRLKRKPPRSAGKGKRAA